MSEPKAAPLPRDEEKVARNERPHDEERRQGPRKAAGGERTPGKTRSVVHPRPDNAQT
ncbi:hypothetical protein [Wenjunlia vitaminophila]|uniref:hypothetical protein n=1 Tax=Wenjunlia vitaminophila TaxID=76728 RepID=UPI0012FF0ECC|nr:hypothetical protein [Wenjunlia vitaminophila]